MVGHKGVDLDAEMARWSIWQWRKSLEALLAQLASRQGPLPGCGARAYVCRFRACAASVLSLLKCALWSTFNKVDECLTVLQHVSIRVDFSKMYVCLQVNCSWKSETHGKGVRSQLKVCSQCQPNTGILLDSSSNEYWMLFWKSLFIQGVLFST